MGYFYLDILIGECSFVVIHKVSANVAVNIEIDGISSRFEPELGGRASNMSMTRIWKIENIFKII